MEKRGRLWEKAGEGVFRFFVYFIYSIGSELGVIFGEVDMMSMSFNKWDEFGMNVYGFLPTWTIFSFALLFGFCVTGFIASQHVVRCML